MVQYQDLVAGDGEAGYEDGPFYLAHFNHPMGLAVSSDGSLLYVADPMNHRIRVIRLDEKNKVETVAGTGMAGKNDGPLSLVSFNSPSALALLSQNQLAVNDQGNNLIRLIDLKKKTVTTLVDFGSSGDSQERTEKIKSGDVWNLAFCPSEQGLYFSKPQAGVLKKVDLKTLQIETILKNDPQVPHPAALCVMEGVLYLADRNLPGVFKLQPSGNKSRLVSLAGTAKKVLALAASGRSLYAFQAIAETPVSRVFPDPANLSFASVWPEEGLLLDSPGSILPHFKGLGPGTKVGFVADPRFDGRFFSTNPVLSIVTSFRDLHLTGDAKARNGGELDDFEYPFAKPPGTFRILLAGRSYPLQVSSNPTLKKCFPCRESKMARLAKRLELELNTRASLDDASLRYEVLDGSRVEHQTLYVWPYYIIPPLAQKYDIDLVVLLMDPLSDLYAYFVSPLGPEGIPLNEFDAEFNLKRNSEKFKAGPLKDFFRLCKDKKIIKTSPEGKWIMPAFNEFTSDPEVRESLIDIIGKPLELFRKKLSSQKTISGKNRRLLFCFFPTGDVFDQVRFPTRGQRLFWMDLCRKKEIQFLDICDDFTALRLTYFPFSDGVENDHFYSNGHSLMATVLSHELLRRQLIPFDAPKSRGQNPKP